MSTIWPHVRRAGRAAALAAYGLLASAGALFVPGPSLAVGALLAVMGWTVVAWLHPAAVDLPPLPHPAVASTRVACFPAAIAGTTVLDWSAGIVVGLGMILATMYATHWISLPPPSVPRGTGSVRDVRDVRSLRAALRRLPIDALLDEWRNTQPQNDLSRRETPHVVRLRELLLDEMLRRDPAGARRWLADGSGEPPDGYVGGRSG